MKKLKCTLLGCGYIADRHIQAFLDCEHTELVRQRTVPCLTLSYEY